MSFFPSAKHSQKTSACYMLLEFHFFCVVVGETICHSLYQVDNIKFKLFFQSQLLSNMDVDQDLLLDYEDDAFMTFNEDDLSLNNNVIGKKTSHVSIHSSGFRDFLLKPELLRAIIDCGYEHPR